MKIEKAIEKLNGIRNYLSELYEGESEAFDLAIQALEKQVSKNPKRIKFDEHISNLNCPSCDCVLFTEFSDGINAGEKVNFCPECGQAIDWSDEQ